MVVFTDVVRPRVERGSYRFELTDAWVVLGLPVIEMAIILLAAFASGSGYHWVFYESALPSRHCAVVGLIVGLLYALPFAFRGDYAIASLLSGRRSSWRVACVWTYVFLILGVIAFLTKSSSVYSRGWAIVFYLSGLLGVLTINWLAVRGLQRARAIGRIARQRVALVGFDRELDEIRARLQHDEDRVSVVGVVSLPAGQSGSGELDAGVVREAVERMRGTQPDDVVVALPWSEVRLIEAIAREVSVLPVAVHLSGARLLDRFDSPRFTHVGSISALTLTPAPLTLLERTAKRSFDIAVASAALVALAPLLAIVAVLIALDGPGKVIFWQRRRGFNHQEFRIAKFRTMTTADDGDNIRQALRDDRRVTRIGSILRRCSIDELPQLWNVLRGEMSIVGPRPHAVAHDRHFEMRIAGYPRRLNVKPGITGWAQVHGLRGETDTDEKMRARVEHDLYYIDNWSLGLDFAIILRTVFSPRSHRNAH